MPIPIFKEDLFIDLDRMRVLSRKEEVMSAASPKEIEEAIKRVNETIAKEINIDEVITAFAKLGIQVKNPDGSFKSWFDILNEMSEVWNKLSVNKDTSQ